jgi:hypothetical protein
MECTNHLRTRYFSVWRSDPPISVLRPADLEPSLRTNKCNPYASVRPSAASCCSPPSQRKGARTRRFAATQMRFAVGNEGLGAKKNARVERWVESATRISAAALATGAGWCYEFLMNLAEIRERHKGKWVLIEYHELDRNLEVVDGDVIALADSKEEIYGKLLTEGRGRNTAIRYCGEWPTDIAVMFWLSASR